MKITKQYTDDHQVKVTAEFEPELLEQFKRRAARKIANRTKIPGFRPGKAPYPMIVSHVGEAAVNQEALELMLDDVYPKVLDEGEITPWGPGNLDKITSEEPPIFEFTIPLEAETVLKDIDSIKSKYELPIVSDQDVADFIQRMRRNAATIVPIETPAAEENVVYITIEGEDTKPAEGADPVIIKSSPQQVLIPSKSEEKATEWPFEGFARSLIGHKAGEELEFDKSFPKNYDDKDLAGKKVHFKVNVQSVKGLELPEMNAEYLDSLGGFTSVEQLEDVVRDRLQSENKETYDNEYYLALVDDLRTKAEIKYPPQMLAQEEEQVLHRIEHDLSHRNLDLDLYLKLRKVEKDQFIQEEVKPTALNRLERSLIMDAIAKQFDIKVDNPMLETVISEVVNELVMSGEFDAMQKELGKKKFAESITMDAANRAMERSIRAKLLSIADPAAVEQPEVEAAEEAEKEAKPAPKPRKKKVAAEAPAEQPAAEAKPKARKSKKAEKPAD